MSGGTSNYCCRILILMPEPGQLKKGADCARGDNANTLKPLVASWLNEASPRPDPLFSTVDKPGRGFYHDITGRLLCPVDYNWLDVS